MAPPSYLFKVQLRDISSPEIYRVLRVPANTTFHRLHKILQTTFGWEDAHMYEFQLFDAASRDYRPKEYLVEHPVDMDTGMAAAMGEPEPIYGSSRSRKISGVFGGTHRLWRGTQVRMVYEYDMGDGWEHEVELVGTYDEDIEPPELLCLAGSGHPCQEDCGGPFGWERLRETLVARNDFDPEEWDIDAVNEKLVRMR